MDKQVKWGFMAAVAAFVFMCGSVGYLALHTARTIPNFGTTVTKLDAVLDHVNKPCKGSGANKADNCGTLALAGQTMVNTGDLIKLTQANERTEAAILNKTLPTLLAHVDTSLVNIDTATAKVPPLIDAATDRLNGMAPLEDALTTLVKDTDTRSSATFEQVEATIKQIDTVMADPNIQKLIFNATQVTGNLAATTGDFQTRFHAILFPPPCLTFWCKFARIYPYIKGAADMGEAAYWTHALFADVKL
jgi:hypothetical protein